MCRLAAFPPGTPKELAHDIVSDFAGGNEHGTGVAYLSGKSFVIQKYPVSYAECLTKGHKLFDHMPHKGWTIAHVRFATHGAHTYPNTHPIIRGDLAVAHNGVFGMSSVIRAALNKSVKWQGDTDTEVGAYMLNSLGPKEFYKAMPTGNGVWLALHRDGSLSVTKLSGDLEMIKNDNDQVIIASQFPFKGGYKMKSQPMSLGVAEVDKDGRPVNFKLAKKEERSYTTGRGLYTPRDIGTQATNMGHGTNGISDTTSRTPLISTPFKVDKIELWNWPDDDRLLEYYQSLP